MVVLRYLLEEFATRYTPARLEYLSPPKVKSQDHSALVSFEVFIRPALRSAMGLPNPGRPLRTAVLAEALTSPAGKRQFRRGVYDPVTATVTSYGPPASHHLRWLASANCLLDIGADVTAVAAGEQITVWDLST